MIFIPEAVILSGFLILLAAEIVVPEAAKRFGAFFSLLSAILIFFTVLPFFGTEQSGFGGMLILDPLACFFKALFAGSGAVVIAMSGEFLMGRGRVSEFFLLLWVLLLALFILVSANDFLVLFVALEMVTLSFYVLAAYLKHDLISIEAGLKYLILGSLASAFLIYGISLIYLSAGSTAFGDVRLAFQAAPEGRTMLLGLLLVLAGLGFKVAAVPFQLWVPDVYQGAPTPAVAFLAVGSKAAGFALLLRLLFTVFLPFDASRAILFSTLAAMTLVFGNLGAILQTDVKRLLGYSSIGHAGYLLIGIAAGREGGISAILYYLAAYAVMTLTAFYVVTLVGRDSKTNDLRIYSGLAKRSPFLAGVFFVALLSLAGVPPTAGFFGKFLILWSAVRSGQAWLALIGALGVAVSLFYYLGVVRAMYIEGPVDETPVSVTPLSKAILLVLVAAIFVLGIWQAPLLRITEFTARSLS